MSARSLNRSRTSLDTKAGALAELIEESAVLVSPESLAELDGLTERLGERSRRSAEHTVIGFFGATGSGKSSLVNAIVGADIARVAHRRPTTSSPLAAIVDSASGSDSHLEGAHDLLDWLDVHERHVVPAKAGIEGMIYVDLPDFDSVDLANREVANKLAAMVDVLVWVSDPEKYADSVLHTEFIRRFAAHHTVTLAILNQADRLSPAEHAGVKRSFEELLSRDGIDGVSVILTSAVTGEGVEEARAACVAVAKRKNAALERLHADVSSAAIEFAPRVGAELKKGKEFHIPGMPERVSDSAVTALERVCSEAAQVSAISDAVGASYRKQAGKRTGWPLVRWIAGATADPLERMRLGRRAKRRAEDSEDEFVSRSSLSIDAPSSRAHIRRGASQFAEAVSADASRPWPARVNTVVEAQEEALPDAIDYALTHTDIRGSYRSWWWTPLNVIQWLALFTAVVGLVWLLGLNALDFFAIPRPQMPMVTGLWIPIPVPTVMVVVGVALGILLAILAGFINRLVASSRRRAANKALRKSMRGAVEGTVAAAVQRECDRAARIERLLNVVFARS